MRIVSAISLLLALILTSCATFTVSEPTSVVSILSTPSDILLPMQTFISEPTATETPQVMPDYMSEYIERGFDKMNDVDTLYLVVDESKVHIAPLTGIVFKERVIRSWYEVDYIENGVLKHGIILGFVRRGGTSPVANLTRMITSNSGSSFPNPSVAYVERVEKVLQDLTSTQFPIFEGFIGVEEGDSTSEILFGDIFPVLDGIPQPTFIPGIGNVLPITRILLVDSPNP